MLILRREDGSWTKAVHRSGDGIRIGVGRFGVVGSRQVLDVEVVDEGRAFEVEGPRPFGHTSTYRRPDDLRLFCCPATSFTCRLGNWIKVTHRPSGDVLGVMVASVERTDVNLGFEDPARNYLLERPECRNRAAPESPPQTPPDPIP